MERAIGIWWSWFWGLGCVWEDIWINDMIIDRDKAVAPVGSVTGCRHR